MNCISGSTMSTNYIQQNIHQAQLRSVSEIGCVPLTKMDYQPHRTTLHNFAALITGENNRSITASEIPKTCTCYTAENPLISAMALLYVISATHYEVISDCCLFGNVSARYPRHNSDHYMVLGCLHSAPLR